jgi:hypothetical protein
MNQTRGIDLKNLLHNLNADFLISLSIEWSGTNYDQAWAVVSYALTRWKLRKLCMSNVNYMMEHISWPDYGMLKHLVIADCVYSEYLLMLHQFPNLETIVMRNCIVDEKIMPLQSSASTFHVTLKSLTMTGCSLISDDLELLLAPIPALHHLKLISDRKQFDTIFDGSYWEEFICTKLSNLSRFEFFFSYKYSRNNNFIDLESLIVPFRAPFWLDKKRWFVTCAYGPELHVIWLYTTPIITISNQSPIRCVISSIDNTCRLIQRPLNEMVDNILDEVCKKIDQRKNSVFYCFKNENIQLTPLGMNIVWFD